MQCKDTLLLDHDHKVQYSKRKIESNFDRYKELPNVDDDDENGQLSAADFQQLLSRPASSGEHFTFAAERSWVQNTDTDNTSDDGSMVSNLFKLNISNLNDGLNRVPFYLRHDLPTDIFTEEELTDIHYRSKFLENEQMQQNQRLTINKQVNQNLLDCLESNVDEKISNKKVESVKASKNDDNDDKSFAETEIVKLLQQTKVTEPSKRAMASTSKSAQIPIEMPSSTLTTETSAKPLSQIVQDRPAQNSSSKANVQKTEDIQDWLDDILNE